MLLLDHQRRHHLRVEVPVMVALDEVDGRQLMPEQHLRLLCTVCRVANVDDDDAEAVLVTMHQDINADDDHPVNWPKQPERPLENMVDADDLMDLDSVVDYTPNLMLFITPCTQKNDPCRNMKIHTKTF